ncbi:hypothetical protein BASA81_002765 [Batrachochytrium salamandrivorans]|nr:hypothetical protein BASA81_002765 [Batrachochytrium salamandrivorans]
MRSTLARDMVRSAKCSPRRTSLGQTVECHSHASRWSFSRSRLPRVVVVVVGGDLVSGGGVTMGMDCGEEVLTGVTVSLPGEERLDRLRRPGEAGLRVCSPLCRWRKNKLKSTASLVHPLV